MTDLAHIAVMDTLGDVCVTVEAVARELGARVQTVHDYAALGRLLEEPNGASVAVIAVERLDEHTVERLAVVHEELPYLKTILVARHGADELVRTGRAGVQRAVQLTLRSGVCDTVPYPPDSSELVWSLKRALTCAATLQVWARRTKDGVPRPAGMLHAVTAARGGTGRTFFAVNMAAFLASAPDEDVCVIDLDAPLGSVADALGLRPRFTVADLIGASGKDLAASIHSYCEDHPLGFSVLAAPPADSEAPMSVDDALRVVRAAQRRFAHVVVDLPLATTRLALSVMREATDSWCVLKADLPSLRTHASLLSSAERLGLDPTAMHVVLNMVEEDGGIAVDDVDRVIPQGLSVALPYTRRAAQATNSARTMLEVDPNGTLTRRLGALFAPMVGEPAEPEAATSRPSRRWSFARRRS